MARIKITTLSDRMKDDEILSKLESIGVKIKEKKAAEPEQNNDERERATSPGEVLVVEKGKRKDKSLRARITSKETGTSTTGPRCPVCGLQPSSCASAPSYCPRCAWHIEGDIAFGAHLCEIRKEASDEYRSRLSVARKIWGHTQKEFIEARIGPTIIRRRVRPLNSQAHQVESLLQEAVNAMRRADFRRARDIYTKALNLDIEEPGRASFAFRDRGICYWRLDLPYSAVKDLSKALMLKQDEPHTHALVGICYDKIGSYERAISNYSKAIALEHDNSVFFFARGDAYERLGYYRKAETDFRQAIALNEADKRAKERAEKLRKMIFHPFGLRFQMNDPIIIDWECRLIWSLDANPAGKNLTYGDALQFIDTLNQQKHGNFAEWRLPKTEEFEMLARFAGGLGTKKYYARFYNEMGFRNVRSSLYWATDGQRDGNKGGRRSFCFNMKYGGISMHEKTEKSYVWPVTTK